MGVLVEIVEDTSEGLGRRIGGEARARSGVEEMAWLKHQSYPLQMKGGLLTIEKSKDAPTP